jgi:hypothetical protein
VARDPARAERIRETKEKLGGFYCTGCKKPSYFGAYVAAHWDMPLIHTCDCGAKHDVLQGTATRIQGNK